MLTEHVANFSRVNADIASGYIGMGCVASLDVIDKGFEIYVIGNCHDGCPALMVIIMSRLVDITAMSLLLDQ